MKNLIKTITIGVVLAAASIAPNSAVAERWPLHKNKHWETYLFQDDDDGKFYCRTAVYGDQVNLLIDLSPGRVLVFVIDDEKNWSDQESEIRMWVDRRADWNVNVSAEGTIFHFSIPSTKKGVKFVGQLINGQKLYFDINGSGGWDYWFSLKGSATSLNALSKCADNLE